MRIVREALEGVMEPRLATATLLDAMGRLGSWSDLANPERVIEFVQGPLRMAVSQRLGSLPAANVTERICAALELVRGSAREGKATRELPFGEGPVRVLVLARSARLGVSVRSSLGGDRVALAHASDPIRAEVLIEQLVPEVVIVDGEEPPHMHPADLRALLRRVDGRAVCILWGCEGSLADTLMRTTLPATLELIPFDRGSGVEPLLDLVSARRAA